MDAGGSLAFALHLGTAGCTPAAAGDCAFLDLQDLVTVGAHARGEVEPGVPWRVEGLLRLHPLHTVDEANDAAAGERIQPLTVDVPEAWIGLDEALVPGLDLRFGQQRFAWGVAQGINPLDVVNPYDLRDPTRFDRRLGVPAVSALLHHRQTAVELVYVPLFRPARLPADIDLLEDADDLFDFSDVGGGDLELGELETRTTTPDARAGFAAFAVRASAATPVADVALVAYRGRDTLPQVGGEARLVGFATDSGRVDVGIPVFYPLVTVAGGEILAPLVWEVVATAEIAVVVPERAVVTAPRTQLEALVDLGVLDAVPDPLPETVLQDGRPFPRWVVGLDRTLGRFVLAAQWVHGLPTERSLDDLGDYGSVAAVVNVSDPVQLRLFAVSDLQGVLAGGEIAILHRDAATLTLGGTWVDGPDGSALGQLRDASRLSLGVSTVF